MRTSLHIILLLMLVIPSIKSLAQEMKEYEFINYAQNRIEFFDCNNEYVMLFDKFNEIAQKNDKQVNIVHIGDSHIQANFITDRVRNNLQNFFWEGCGSRGFVFPYNMAQLHNSSNYDVSYSGSWSHCTNVDKFQLCEIGVSGMAVKTFDHNASIKIYFKEDASRNYEFDQIKIFHNTNKNSFDLQISNYKGGQKIIRNNELGYTLIELDEAIDTLELAFFKNSITQKSFILHGISLESSEPGVVYNSLGVNGAKAESFLKCSLLEKHLLSLEPDWIVISLGTNDAYNNNFDPRQFEIDYSILLKRIKKVLPHVAILLTVPGDSYKHGKIVNRNTPVVRDGIYRIARQNKCAVWNLFDVMGGLNSIFLWHSMELASDDRLHLTVDGYNLQGDLLFDAIIKAYDNYIDYWNN